MEPDELTRRLLLLRLGALTGIGAVDLEAAAQPELPPGLYQPSADHLAHVLKPAADAEPPHAPVFFSSAEYRQIQGIVASMLGEKPETEPVPEIVAWLDLLVFDAAAVREAARSLSPAHRALAAAYYGEAAVHELETFDAQQLSRAGLARLNAEPRGLEPLEIAGDPFVRWLKSRVIEGFYTSRAGLKELDYKGNSFYGISPGCEV